MPSTSWKQPGAAPFLRPLLVCLAATVATSAYAQQEPCVDNEPCFECHGDPTETMEFEDGQEVSIGIEEAAFQEAAHGRFACVTCHRQVDLDEHPGRELPSRTEYARELERECERCHLSGAEEGAKIVAEPLHSPQLERPPGCGDCHRPHTMAGAGTLTGRSSNSQGCSNCHAETYRSFSESVHGASLRSPWNPDVPVCVDCHGGHGGRGTADLALRLRTGRPCLGCHSDEQRMQKYELSTNVVETYLKDFHGVTVKFYERERRDIARALLVCADCHGLHDVGRASGSSSASMKKNLLKVCRRCHAEATENFPDAWLSHYEPSLSKAPLVYLVKVAYWIFIPFVIGGLALQILFHLVVLPVRRRIGNRGRADPELRSGAPEKRHQAPGAGGKGTDRLPEYFARFGLRPRIEHLLVMVTFAILVATGLSQKFHESAWSARFILLLGGIDMVRLSHRVAGVLFTGVAVIHLCVSIASALRRGSTMSIVPKRKDFRDAIVTLRYYLGLSQQQARFDRFDYRQKFEYWGMFFGSAIMIASGFILYFPILSAKFLPGQVIPAARVAHSYEAMMALLTIIVWHMYSVMLNPDCFPLDTSIFTGKLSRERMMREHPLELEQ